VSGLGGCRAGEREGEGGRQSGGLGDLSATLTFEALLLDAELLEVVQLVAVLLQQ
jgi:hypothetical protein